jgi:serine/threonine-protein kinase
MVGGDDDAAVREKALPEIRQLVEEAMTRFGMAGDLQLNEQWLVLYPHGTGEPAYTDIRMLIEQWSLLPFDVRQKRCHELARRLQQQRQVSLAAPAAQEESKIGSTTKLMLAATLAIAVSAGVLAFTRGAGAPALGTAQTPAPQTGPAASSALAQSDAERKARALRVCRSTQSRVMRGATVGPIDVEGWLVEMVVFARGTHPWQGESQVAELLTRQDTGAWQVTSTVAPELSALEGPGTEVRLEPYELTGSAGAAGNGQEPSEVYSGVKLSFTGRYVTPYFKEDERISYVRFGNALIDALGADHGALFARCEGDTSQHMGAWFRGPSPGAASALLLFAMGAHAQTPHLRANLLSAAADGSFDPGYSWLQLQSLTAPLKRARIATLFGNQGGMLAGKAGEDTTIVTFPFRDANRAERSSLILAQELGIAAHN